jgi:hypothetical protein
MATGQNARSTAAVGAERVGRAATVTNGGRVHMADEPVCMITRVLVVTLILQPVDERILGRFGQSQNMMFFNLQCKSVFLIKT